MQKRIYVDMDDVLCDYRARMDERRRAVPAQGFPQAEWGFFLRLAPLPGALDGIRALAKHFDTWILTRPSTPNPLCYTEKRVRVEEHLGPDWVERLIMCPDKSLLRGDVLIDDTPWPHFQGEQLLFGSAEFPDWSRVLTHLGLSENP